MVQLVIRTPPPLFTRTPTPVPPTTKQPLIIRLAALDALSCGPPFPEIVESTRLQLPLQVIALLEHPVTRESRRFTFAPLAVLMPMENPVMDMPVANRSPPKPALIAFPLVVAVFVKRMLATVTLAAPTEIRL